MSVATQIDLHWVDPQIRINWTAVGPQEVDMNSSAVWIMNLNLVNPASSEVSIAPASTVHLNQPGRGISGTRVRAKYIGSLVTSCDAMDLTEFPFDVQDCQVTLMYRDTGKEVVQFLGNSTISVPPSFSSDEWEINNVTTTYGSYVMRELQILDFQ